MKKLMIIGHPNIETSTANKLIIEHANQALDNIEIRNIAELYPDYRINVLAEQEALKNADLLIFQFPLYWYSVPAILKKYFDDVFSHQFAYGSQGDKLTGKFCLLSFTTGANKEDYTPIGIENYRLPEFLKGLEQTIYYTQMQYLDPIFSQSMMFIDSIMGNKNDILKRAEKHADELIKKIKHLEI